MLVLTRRPGQALLIGDDVEIYIAEVKGDVVRLSIRAPREVSILRREVRDAIQRENQQAAEADTEFLTVLAQISPTENPATPAPSKHATATPVNVRTVESNICN